MWLKWLTIRIKQFIRHNKMRLAIKWAEQYGFYVVRMKQVAGTNYIIDSEGNHLKIDNAEKGAKRNVVVPEERKIILPISR